MYKHTVQYYETDKMGIVHHSNYIRWMEEARIDYLKKIGWDFVRLEAMGIVSPVTSVEFQYKEPTVFSDDVFIYVFIEEFKGVRLKLAYLFEKEDGKLVGVGYSEHCFLNPKGMPIRMKSEIPELYTVLTHCAEYGFNKALHEKYSFRSIRAEEADQAVAIEQICFPPNEACKEPCMRERIKKVPELFLTAVDRKSGKLVGFLNGIATNETAFRDDFFLQADLYEADGKQVMLLGLDVLPEYRGKGIAREIVLQYKKREYENQREKLILTCHEEKIEMYQKFGFKDLGVSESTWGEESWHEMCCEV